VYRTVRLCSSGGGYEAVPESPRRLDLARVRAGLERAGVPVVDARVMLIAALESEVTISQSGRLLFKTADAARAERLLTRLRPLLEGGELGEPLDGGA
jgi:hypothetical protein